MYNGRLAGDALIGEHVYQFKLLRLGVGSDARHLGLQAHTLAGLLICADASVANGRLGMPTFRSSVYVVTLSTNGLMTM